MGELGWGWGGAGGGGRVKRGRVQAAGVAIILVVGLLCSLGGLYAARFFDRTRVAGPVRWDTPEDGRGRWERVLVTAGVVLVTLFAWGFFSSMAILAAQTAFPAGAGSATTLPATTLPATTVPATTAPTTQGAAMQGEPFAMIGALVVGYAAASGVLVVMSRLLLVRAGGGGAGAVAMRSGALKSVAAGLLGLLLALPWIYLVHWATVQTLRALNIEVEAQHEILRLLREGGSGEGGWRVIVAVILSAVVAAPLFEELLFRGTVQTGFAGMTTRLLRSEVLGRWAAIVAASVLFALLHPGWSWPAIFVLSLGLGYVYERTGNLLAPISMHVAFNALSVTATVFSTPS